MLNKSHYSCLIIDKFDINLSFSQFVKITQFIGAVLGSLDFIICSVFALIIFSGSESIWGYVAATIVAGWGVLALVVHIVDLSKKESEETGQEHEEESGAEREI